MDDIAYVSRLDQVRQQIARCHRCGPQVLCTVHVQAMTRARRGREATLLRGRP